MNDQMPKDLKVWEGRRKLGRTKFILLYGVVFWGVVAGTIATLLSFWRRGFSVSTLLIAAIIWPVAGWFVGASIWTKSEEKYRQFTAARNPSR